MGLIEYAKDIITLSKEAGITLSESMEIYKMYKKDSSEDKKPDPEKEPPEKTEKREQGKEHPEKAPKNEEAKMDPDDVIDYKSKFEELEKKLADIQKENSTKDVSGGENKKSDEEIINDITRSFM